MAYNFDDSVVSTELSSNPSSDKGLRIECGKAPRSLFVFSFELSTFLASLSTALHLTTRRKKMRAKFDRNAYARSIEDADKASSKDTIRFSDDSLRIEDYRQHIKETSGKVLPCSEGWYK